jgi:hypothetical protein
MQILRMFTMSPLEYKNCFKQLKIYPPESCPYCHLRHSFYTHGCYERYPLGARNEYRIPIARFCCKSFRYTISILSYFCLPNFQYGLSFIVHTIKQGLSGNLNKSLYPIYRFYCNRLRKNMTKIMMSLRSNGLLANIAQGFKEKAIKLMKLFRDQRLSQRYFTQHNHSFMAI